MGKILTVYYSRKGENYWGGKIVDLKKGNTQRVAEFVQKAVGGELFEVDTVKTYSADYHKCTEEAQAELQAGERVEPKAYLDSLADYDTIFVGYPIWWSDMPMAVYTFLESYDFAGKTVIPFCTHAGSGLSGTVSSIKSALPTAAVLDGLSVSGTTAQNDHAAAQSSVDTFLNGLDILHSTSNDISAVYMTTSISPSGLMEVYLLG